MENSTFIIEEAEKVLQEMGFEKIVSDTNTKIVDELYNQDYSFLNECIEKPRYTIRKILYKNEYHDEEHILIQATGVCTNAGLGNVKKYLQDFINMYFKKDMSLELRPAFIYQTVPAIEASTSKTAFAAGGLVRPEVMRKKEIDSNKYVGFSFVILPEKLKG